MSTATKNTIYSEYVFQQIYELRCSGGGCFNFTDLAKTLGLKPTHNLRARLRQAEAQGSLSIGYGVVGEHGSQYIYTLRPFNHNPSDLSDIPF